MKQQLASLRTCSSKILFRCFCRMAFRVLGPMLIEYHFLKTALCEQGDPPIYRLRPFVRYGQYSTSENEDLERCHIAGTLSSAIKSCCLPRSPSAGLSIPPAAAPWQLAMWLAERYEAKQAGLS